MKKIFYFTIVFLFIFSCSKQEGSLKVIIISQTIESKKNLKTSMYKSYRNLPNSNLSGKTFRFSIKNTSKNNYLLRLRNVFDTYPGLMSNNGKNFDLDFLEIIETSFKDTIVISRHHVLKYDTEETIKQRKKSINYFKNLKYNNSTIWHEKNKLINSNFIFIKSEGEKYFEVYINLPYSDASTSGNHYDLDSTKNYNVFLKLTSDTTNIKKYLTWPQLKNIEENNYKLFHGTIISENSVPIVFVD